MFFKIGKKYFQGDYNNMKILPIYNSFNTQNKINFGSTDRFYKTDRGKEIGNSSWIFREDINWRDFSEFLIHNFRNKEQVNIIQFAASDGSEGYTQIISLLENPNKKDVSKFFPIQAYDIDDFIVTKAQSGKINLGVNDIARLRTNSIPRSKYFIRKPLTFVPENLYQKVLQSNPDEIFGVRDVFEVSDILQDKIIFDMGDMFKILPEIKDDSNTVILCRNILGYFHDEPEKIEKFIQTASAVLEKGSVFVIGKLDTDYGVDKILKENSFLKMQNNVYMKI